MLHKKVWIYESKKKIVFLAFPVLRYLFWVVKKVTTRMTRSRSSEADWNYKKYVWTTENWYRRKRLNINQGINISIFFTFLPFVALLTDRHIYRWDVYRVRQSNWCEFWGLIVGIKNIVATSAAPLLKAIRVCFQYLLYLSSCHRRN